MVKRLLILSGRAGLWLALACVPLTAQVGQYQDIPPLPSDQYFGGWQRKIPDRLPQEPSLPPAFTVPLSPLGFSSPGPYYRGRHNSLASLDFLDENRLLFSFQVLGLLDRKAGDSFGSEERRIRAVVVTLPGGRVEAETLWTVYDRARYLWMLKDGHFLLRGRDSLELGDASLQMKPSLGFPGRLLWLQMDPAQQFMAANFLVPAGAQQEPAEVAGPAATPAGITSNGQAPGLHPDLIVRTLKRDSGQVILTSRLRLTVPQAVDSDGYVEAESAMLSGLLDRVQLPINSEGYLKSTRENGAHWILNLHYFAGGIKVLDLVDSTCAPRSDFISDRELLVSACAPKGGLKLTALSTGGRWLWEFMTSADALWPLLVKAPDGSRFVRETVTLNHSVDELHPFNLKNVKGQAVRVFDAADGRKVFEAPVSPVLDAGGNVAISPSGRRVAILNGGAIQIFELPAPPSLPDKSTGHSRH
jgi:hypothetical protein